MQTIARRILFRLEEAEWREIDPWYRDDLRISWITVLRASRGESIPFIAATYAVLGLHPDKVFPAIEARRDALTGCHATDKKGRQIRTLPLAPKKQTALDHYSRAA